MTRSSGKRATPRLLTHPLAAILSLALWSAAPAGGSPLFPERTGPSSWTSPADTGDGCRQTGGQRPDTTVHVGDLERWRAWQRGLARAGAEYRCVIHAGLSPVRLVIYGDTTIPSLDSIVVIPDSAAALARQTLQLMGDMPDPWAADLVRMLDLDADGYRDLLVGATWGATGNTMYNVWRFHPATRRFVADSTLSNEFNPVPVPGAACVWTYANSSVLDYQKAFLCLRGAEWNVDSLMTSTWNRDAHTVTYEVSARRGSSLAVVKRSVRPDSLR